ncbi:M35 family metallo-endopeptidase [Massilia niastensis]|uniref:M35 family metallo-endopeptidase n=1 Tax=Massilia niastensis TaxID=544911 RepID=UPI00036F497B|nr:M35 family metallo-endopeptidase [Massilia niastensis]
MTSYRRATSAVLVLGFAQAACAAVTVDLAPLRPAVGRGDDVQVRVTLTNTSSVAQHVLRWRTPQGGVEAPLFEVRRDGAPVRYLGIQVKRAPPTAADYLRLAPNASVTQTVELSALYEMNVTGAYTVRYHSPAAPQGPAAMQAVAGELTSAPVSIWVEGRLPRGSKSAPAAATAASPGLAFSKCSNAQQEQLAAAVDAGRAMAADSHAYLATRQPYGARYLTWFGAQDGQRGAQDGQRSAQVGASFTAIKDAFETRPLRIDCGCNAPYYAYVYPAQPYTVYVCKAFWGAPLTGTDSRGGTLVHELSHFDVVAGTDDHVYGQSGAAELARTAPARAVDNADSYEYFGENTPPLQ